MLPLARMRALLLAVALVTPLSLSPAAVHAQPKGGNKSAARNEEALAKKATAHFIKGNDLYKLKRYSLALEQFKQSYATVPSPNSHFYIARCIRDLGDTRAAYIEFTKVIEEATARAVTEEKYALTRDGAATERDELLPKIALVTLSAPQAAPSAVLRLGAEVIPREQWDKPIPVAPGKVEATLQVEGKPDILQTLTVAGGEKKTVVLAPPAASPDIKMLPSGSDDGVMAKGSGNGRVLRPAAYVAGGVGVVGMGIFTVAGILTLSAHSSLEKKCGLAPCSPDLADEVHSGQTKQVVANVGLVIGAVGLATGATLFVLSLRKNKTEGGASARVVLSPNYAGIHGEF